LALLTLCEDADVDHGRLYVESEQQLVINFIAGELISSHQVAVVDGRGLLTQFPQHDAHSVVSFVNHKAVFDHFQFINKLLVEGRLRNVAVSSWRSPVTADL